MDDDYAIALIRSRCGDALTRLELDQIEAAIRQRPALALIDAEMADTLKEALDAMQQRQDEMDAELAALRAQRDRAQEAEEIEASFIDSADQQFH